MFESSSLNSRRPVTGVCICTIFFLFSPLC